MTLGRTAVKVCPATVGTGCPHGSDVVTGRSPTRNSQSRQGIRARPASHGERARPGGTRSVGPGRNFRNYSATRWPRIPRSPTPGIRVPGRPHDCRKRTVHLVMIKRSGPAWRGHSRRASLTDGWSCQIAHGHLVTCSVQRARDNPSVAEPGLMVRWMHEATMVLAVMVRAVAASARGSSCWCC